MKATNPARRIMVFGDYRNYFQNRVTLQLLSRAVELGREMAAEVSVVVIGDGVDEWVGEYIAHGAHRVYVYEHVRLKDYNIETYAFLLARLAAEEAPEIILVGSTAFGRELAPRVAKKLGTGLTADCIALDLKADGLLVQTAPAFGGSLLAEIVTPGVYPQMATVRAGIYQEIPHDYAAQGEIVRLALPEDLPRERVRLVRSERQPTRAQRLEDARVVVLGGRGMGSKKKFKGLYELAGLLGAEVGATRPVVYARWAGQEALVGQAEGHIRPQVLFSFGISGAIQHTAGIDDGAFIIAINKNPQAAMMEMADVAIVADAPQVCAALIRELKRRIRS